MGALSKLNIFTVFTVILTCTSIITHSTIAQEPTKQKPKINSIIPNVEYFNKKTSDDKYAKIAEKLYKQYLKANNLEKFAVYSDIHAKEISIAPTNSKDVYIVSQIMEPPARCYAKGCTTFIYRSTDGKSWSTVFSGHVRSLWYDQSSITINKPANLIASSETNNKNPGVWMWNNGNYFLANRKN